MEKTKILRHHEVQKRSRLLRKGNAVENRHQDNAPATTAIGHRRTRALNDGGNRKICKRHQTSEVIE